MNKSASIISIDALRTLKAAQAQDETYTKKINSLDKLDLLEEMVKFQEERNQQGELTLAMMVRGKILFGALEESAETDELRLLTRSYKRHLDLELQNFLKKKKNRSSHQA